VAAALLRIETPDVDCALGVLAKLGVHVEEQTADHLLVTMGELGPDVINAALVRADVAVRGLHVERPLLEDLFVKLTGEGFDVVR
jgi:ABC-2 type transport system ATP-binding protein